MAKLTIKIDLENKKKKERGGILGIFKDNKKKAEGERIADMVKEDGFKVEKYTQKIEVYTFDVDCGKALDVIGRLSGEPLTQVRYTDSFVENVGIPEELVGKIRELENPIDLTEDTELVEKVIEALPLVGPKDVLKAFNSMGLEDVHFDNFKEHLRNLFPCHPEPFMMSGKEGDISFAMSFRRAILHASGYIAKLGNNGMNYNTLVGFGVSYDPKKGNFLKESLGSVEKARKILFMEG